MSEPTLEDRIRALRKRIMQEMFKAPLYILQAVNISDTIFNPVFGKYRLGATAHDYSLGVADANGNPVVPTSPQLWQGSVLTPDDVEQMASSVPPTLVGYDMPVRIEWGDGNIKGGKSKIWGIECHTWQETNLSTKRINLPSTVAPSDTLELMASGKTYYFKGELGVDDYVEAIIVVGRVGVKQQDGSWAVWQGYAVFINASNVSNRQGATIFTPVGAFTVNNDGSHVWVESAFMSAYMSQVAWGGC